MKDVLLISIRCANKQSCNRIGLDDDLIGLDVHEETDTRTALRGHCVYRMVADFSLHQNKMLGK